MFQIVGYTNMLFMYAYWIFIRPKVTPVSGSAMAENELKATDQNVLTKKK